ncbi:hypothetical protein RB614_13335 [Phytohabitans sp. ZYX-F-186]|uniref:Uncharacterized protein n=1 Tax=Phytohabitans maris TaxID=3071409 RepID=A0ABU0ZGN8_9ACTN|nr:hypothetical protein [Phytohabitans sp. ZYX-F-186]MDQ7905507.1 hypothetical protein [Phytohabitans sp. ZYX-F-186]
MSAPVLARKVAEAAILPCPKWCDGSCAEWTDKDGSTSHWGDFAEVVVDSHERSKVAISVTLTQIDSASEGRGDADVHLVSGRLGEDFRFTAATARQLAGGLLNAADTADPLPAGVTQILAEEIHVGDEIETPDGWQAAYMIMIDSRARSVAAFTDERDASDTDGWPFEFGDPVTVRRAVAR